MLIEQFIAPDTEFDRDGLPSIHMSRLGYFVALAGKNGAGKTRILNRLYQTIARRSQLLGELSFTRSQLKTTQRLLAIHQDSAEAEKWKTQAVDYENRVDRALNRVPTTPPERRFDAIRFVPKDTHLSDQSNLNKKSLLNYFEKTKEPGFANFQNGCFSYIQVLQDRLWEAEHPSATITSERRHAIASDYGKLEKTIFLLLKSRLSRSEDGIASIFGRPLAEAGLSAGQTVLIQLAIALHAQNKGLDNTVLILDEPENHLHPSALIEFLSALSEIARSSQIWIATHSVPLLAYIAGKEPMSIWYVEDGQVNNAGRHPERVLRSLLGNDEQIELLHAFTALPAQYAAINFSVECLVPPKVMDSSSGDHQVAQIAKMIDMQPPRKCRLLDFGAGKGRLLLGLLDVEGGRLESLIEKIDYLAFDTSEKDKTDCISAIQSIYGKEKRRHFSTREEFFAKNDEASLDIIVLCNVMHEISPTDWLSLFGIDSLIFRALKDTGYVLIVEDQRIPTGERAHEFGFLILDTAHLRTLFSVTNDDLQLDHFVEDDYRNDNRLKAHLVSKALIARISGESRARAIGQLLATARDRVKKIRNEAPNYLTGQMHGFWTQQFANAALYLEQS